MPLYAFGSNGSGQLGLGHEEDMSVPTRCLFEDPSPPPSYPSTGPAEPTNSSKIRRIAAGGNHTLILYEDGSVYAAGSNVDGRCGRDPASGESESMHRFGRVVVSDPVTGRRVDVFKDVAATWEGSFLVASLDGVIGDEEEGEVVFALGSGARGELGLGEDCGKASSAARVSGLPLRAGVRVSGIASGMGHSVVVLSNGEVYGWGGARKGQLGEEVRDRRIVWEPVRVGDVPFRATGAVCGREFTVVMGDAAAGELVVLGSKDNKWGILSGLANMGSLAGYAGGYASWHGVYVHQRDSSVVAWGRNDRGQLPPAGLSSPKKLAIGSEHGMALLNDGTVKAFGWGEHGNCGPDTDPQGNVSGGCNEIPITGEGASVVDIGAGCATSWIITS